MAKPAYGGWVTFTEHLAKTVGIRAVVKIGKRTGASFKILQGDALYTTMAPTDLALKKSHRLIVTAADKSHAEALRYVAESHGDVGIVIHDPTELSKEMVKLLNEKRMDVYTIRKSVQKLLADEYGIDSVMFRHPYCRMETPKQPKARRAVSTSRIDFDKHTDVLVAANDIEPLIDIWGERNRIYTYHKLENDTNFNEYYKGRFGKEAGAVRKLLDPVMFCCDMSAIKKDGAGTQYTFLEAMDAGTALILNNKWFSETDTREALQPNENCYAVSTPQEIVRIIKEEDPTKIVAAAKHILRQHEYYGEDMVAILAKGKR